MRAPASRSPFMATDKMSATGFSWTITAKQYARSYARGKPGETYNVGDSSEKRNIDIVETVCSILDEDCPQDPVVPHRQLITFVKDRPGHDRRYAIDARKIERDLGWKPGESFDSGIRKTVRLVFG